MTTLEEYHGYGEELERLLLLRTSPIAVKMLEKEEDIPDGAYRPRKDDGVHLPVPSIHNVTPQESYGSYAERR